MEPTDFSGALHSQLPSWVHALFVTLFPGGPLGHSASPLVLTLVLQRVGTRLTFRPFAWWFTLLAALILKLGILKNTGHSVQTAEQLT